MNGQENQGKHKRTSLKRKDTFNNRSVSYLDQFTKKFLLKNRKVRCSPEIHLNANILLRDEKWKVKMLIKYFE